MFWLGALLPICNWLGILLAVHFEIPAHSLTGPWFAVLPAMAFGLGAASISLAPLWRGLAVGLSLSSAIAVAQLLGWSGIPSMQKPAGLFYNSAIEALAIALVMIALTCNRDWRYIPAMLPGFLLATSRGAFLVLAVSAIAGVNWRYALLVLLAAGAFVLTWPGPSDLDRLLIWGAAFNNLDWAGHGAGSFANLMFVSDGELHYPGHVHNDYLQLAYEFGIAAAAVYLIYAAALARAESPYWPVFVGFAVAGFFFFPLYSPLPSFIGAALAGNILCISRRVGVPNAAF